MKPLVRQIYNYGIIFFARQYISKIRGLTALHPLVIRKKRYSGNQVHHPRNEFVVCQISYMQLENALPETYGTGKKNRTTGLANQSQLTHFALPIMLYYYQFLLKYKILTQNDESKCPSETPVSELHAGHHPPFPRK